MLKLSVLCGIAGVCAMSGAAYAGEWRQTGVTDGSACVLKFEGAVAAGDAQALQQAIETFETEITQANQFYYMADYPYDSVCLNSEGGNFAEGVKMAQVLNRAGYGTLVEAGDVCMSACAVAFMGGSYHSESDRGTQPKRALHPTARLGFHAPSLNVPKSQYSEAIVADAYAAALGSIAELQEVADEIRFPRSLLVDMLGTPPADMMFVETVGQATRWRMIVTDVQPVTDVQAAHMENACENIDAGLLDEDPREWGFYLVEGGDPYTLTNESGSEWVGEYTGFRQEMATPCSFYYNARVATDRLHVTYDQGLVELVEWVDLHAYQLFAPETKLIDLPRQ